MVEVNSDTKTVSIAYGGARDALNPEYMATILASSRQKGVLEQLMTLFLEKFSRSA